LILLKGRRELTARGHQIVKVSALSPQLPHTAGTGQNLRACEFRVDLGEPTLRVAEAIFKARVEGWGLHRRSRALSDMGTGEP